MEIYPLTFSMFQMEDLSYSGATPYMLAITGGLLIATIIYELMSDRTPEPEIVPPPPPKTRYVLKTTTGRHLLDVDDINYIEVLTGRNWVGQGNIDTRAIHVWTGGVADPVPKISTRCYSTSNGNLSSSPNGWFSEEIDTEVKTYIDQILADHKSKFLIVHGVNRVTYVNPVKITSIIKWEQPTPAKDPDYYITVRFDRTINGFKSGDNRLIPSKACIFFETQTFRDSAFELISEKLGS